MSKSQPGPSNSFIPENSLEERLVEASTDPGKRPAFYRELLGSDLFVLGVAGRGGEAKFVAEEGDTIQIAHWSSADGRSVIPMFSSLQRLTEAITREESYIRLGARALMEMTEGTPIVLNPGSMYGKEFTPSEVKGLLDGSLFSRTEAYTVEEAQEVLLGQPSVYPHRLVDALKSLFAGHPQVESAYLGHIFNPATGDSPHTIVGVKDEGDYSRVVADAGMVAGEVLAEGVHVDFIQIGEDPASRYLLESTEAFYVRG